MNRENLIGLALESGLSHKFANAFADTAEHIYTKGIKTGAAAEREKVAQWMIQRGYATGHGDTLEDLLQELDWQIAKNWTQAMVNGVKTEREQCAKVCDSLNEDFDHLYVEACAEAIRARGEK